MNRRTFFRTLAFASAVTTVAPAFGQFGRLMGGRKAAQPPLNPEAAGATTAAAPPTVASGPKKQGMVRVGVVAPQSNMGPAEGLKTEWARLLVGPRLEAVYLTASLPGQAEAEAKEKECDFVLYSAMTQKLPDENSSKKNLLRGATQMANTLPMFGMARGIGAMVATTVASTTLSTITSSVKAKGAVTMEYSLQKADGGEPVAKQSLSATASQDGEDIVSPLVRQAAGEIAQKVLPQS